MLSFLKRAKKKGKDSAVSSDQLFGQKRSNSPK